jgi:hypothetical protein
MPLIMKRERAVQNTVEAFKNDHIALVGYGAAFFVAPDRMVQTQVLYLRDLPLSW